MKTTIQSIGFDAADRLLAFVEQKLNKLKQFYDGIVDAQVFLKLQNTKDKDTGNKIVEIKLLVPGQTLIATQQAPTFEEATDLCMDQLKRQVIKYKEKQVAV